MNYYRTVCLKSNVEQNLVFNKALCQNDRWIQDDFVIVYGGDKSRCILLNTKFISCRNIISLYGIVIVWMLTMK